MVAIFVAFMFVSLVLTDVVVEKWRVLRVAHSAMAKRPSLEVEHILEALCQVPEGVHLADQHTWVKPDPKGGLEIGADALIARAVGAVGQIVLPKVGDEIAAGQPLFRLEHQEGAITVPSTFTGRITAVNAKLAEHPSLLNSDPYGAGWVCRLTPTHLEESRSGLRLGEPAVTWLESEFARFSDFLTGQLSPDLALGVTSQDGGIPAAGCLSELGPAAWSEFQARFLRKP